MKEFAKTHPKYNMKTGELNIKFLQEEVRDIKSTLKAIQTIHSQFKRETDVTKYGLWTKKIEEWQVDQVDRIIDDKDKKIFGYKQVIAGPGSRTEGNIVLDISGKDFEIYGKKYRIHELLQELKNLNDGITVVRQGPNSKITVLEPINLRAINKEYQDMKNNINNLEYKLKKTKETLQASSKKDLSEITTLQRSKIDRENDLIVVNNNAVDTNKKLEKEYANIQKIILDADKSQYEKLLKKGFSLKIASNTNTIGLFPFITYSDDYETLQKHARNGPINQKTQFLSTSKIDGGLPPILVGVVTDEDITEGEINIGLEKQPQAKAEIAKLKEVAKITEEKEWPESPELKKELSSLESSEVHPIEKVSVKRISKIIEDKYILLKDKDGKPLVDSKGNSIRILKMQIASWNSTFDAFDENTFGEVLVNTLNGKYFRDEETYKKLNAEWWYKPSQEDVNNAFGIDFEEYFNNLPIKGLDGKTISRLLQEGEQVILPHIPMNIYQTMYDNMMFDLDNNDVRFFIPQNNMVVV